MTRPSYQRLSIAALSSILIAALLWQCTGVGVTTYFEKGAVVTAAPLATEAGKRIFEIGGNAFDAAVAVGFVLAVVHPEAGNIGGGGFALIRDAANGRIRALDFRETAPAAAHETMFVDSLGEVIPNLSLLGAKAVGIPGTVAGLYELWSQYGSLPWEELIRQAAALADTGYFIDDYLSKSLNEEQKDLSSFSSSSSVFYPSGHAPRPDERLMQKQLARTLYLIAAQGRDGFYQGETADSLVATVQKYGGIITQEDLSGYASLWREPIHIKFDSLDIYSMPPPSSGGVLLSQILKLLEPFDFSGLSPRSPQYIHLFSEASRLAFADRSEHFGDPAFYQVPVDRLLNEAYLDLRRSLINRDHATPSDTVRPGFFTQPESDQTTHFAAVDAQGNMVAITYTLNSSYGSKLVVEGCGFLLNNEMDDFSAQPGVRNQFDLIGGEANKIEPGKRMLSSMAPTLVLKEGRPMMLLGAPGGSKIITVVAQAILNLSRFNLPAEEAVAQARFHHQWLPDILYLEQGGFDINTKQELIRYGYSIEEQPPYSDLQLITITGSGLMTGAADPRNRGAFGGL